MTRRRAILLGICHPLLALIAVSVSSAQAIFDDGFEPGSPSSWSSTSGWSCPDGDAPVAGNPLIEEAGDPGCPAGMAAVDTFCVDRFEASLAAMIDGGDLAPWSPYVTPTDEEVRALSVRGVIPQGYVNAIVAAAACANAGKRLCTNTEWLRACRGPSAFTYPWGNSAEPGRCNDARAVHPAVEYYQSSDSEVFTHLDQPCLNQLPRTVERTGNRAACVSAEGLVDLMGNLEEWTSDAAGTFRGGDYLNSTSNGNGCLNATTAHDTSHAEFRTGFRCCADPQ